MPSNPAHHRCSAWIPGLLLLVALGVTDTAPSQGAECRRDTIEAAVNSASSPGAVRGGARGKLEMRPLMAKAAGHAEAHPWLATLGWSLATVTLAALASALAFQTTRRWLDTERTRGITAERQRIARDLHDEIGPRIAELSRFSHQLTTAHAGTDSPARALGELSRELNLSLERTLWCLESDKSTLDDLLVFLGRYIDTTLKDTGIPCRRSLPFAVPDLELEPGMRHAVVLIFKEALNNALRHAQATEIHYRATIEPQRLVLELEDNGHGLAGDHHRHGGRGLANMRQRAEAIGGHFNLDAGPTGGCVIRLDLPLPAAAL